MLVATSIMLGSISVVLGLAISFHYATAGGATIAFVNVVLFVIALIGRELQNLFNQRQSTAIRTDQ